MLICPLPAIHLPSQTELEIKKMFGRKFATSYENLVATLNSHSSLKKVIERKQYLVQYKCETVTVFQSAIGPTDLTQNSKN